MRTALALARQAAGATWPNPAVGCVIVAASGRVAGQAATACGGRPHAEIRALEQAGERARGGTAYVTLEPCAHDGATPSCARALAAAGIVHVVMAIPDPDPRTNGAGAGLLAAAGVDVTCGPGADDAKRLHAGHRCRVNLGRPHVTLKLAASLDGRIATSAGASQWLTGPLSRRHAHLLRARHDAVLVGAGTAHHDDPELLCRLPGFGQRSPVRVLVLGTRTPVPSGRLLATVGAGPVWLLADAGRRARAAPLEAAGARIIDVAVAPDGHLSLEGALAALAAHGMTSVLVEGGQKVATSLLRQRLVDTVVWYGTDAIVGGDGLAAIGALGRTALAETGDFRTVAGRRLGPDHVRFLERIS